MMKSFIKNLTREFEFSNKKTKIGIISFTEDNLQLFDLHSYHDNKHIDSQIDKLNYEGNKANSGALNRALGATEANMFTGERDVSVPRLLLVFDTASKKDDQTEAKGVYHTGTDIWGEEVGVVGEGFGEVGRLERRRSLGRRGSLGGGGGWGVGVGWREGGDTTPLKFYSEFHSAQLLFWSADTF